MSLHIYIGTYRAGKDQRSQPAGYSARGRKIANYNTAGVREDKKTDTRSAIEIGRLLLWLAAWAAGLVLDEEDSLGDALWMFVAVWERAAFR